MKYLSLTFLFTFILFCNAISQQIDLTWGPEKKSEKSSTELGFVGRIKDHFYTLRKEQKIMYLKKTRIKDMTPIWERPIQWNEFTTNDKKKRDLTFHSFRLFKEHFIFFFEEYTSKEDIQRIYGQIIDFEGKPQEQLVEIGKRIKQRRSQEGSFSLDYSPDSTHFLLTINPYYERYSNEKFQFKIFDQQLNVTNNLEVTLPFKDQDFGLQSTNLTRSNTICLLARIDIPRKERKDKEVDYYYELVTVDPAEKGKVKEFEISLKEKYIDQVDVILDKNDNVKCFGMYANMKSNGRREDGINGIFYFTVEKNNIKNLNLKEFDSKLVAEIAGKKRANKDKGLEAKFNIKFFFEKPDGGAIVLTEEQYINVVTTTTSTGTGGTSRSTTYHYYNNSILAVNIDPAGKIIWYAHIPKLQHTVNENRWGSFWALYVKGKIYMIYNDEKTNAITKTYDKQMINYLAAVPVAVTLNESGKFDKQMLASGKPGKQEFIIKPKISDKISDNEAFLYADRVSKACCVVGARKSKAQRFGLLTIK